MTLTKEEMLHYCTGCHNDFYNGNNPYNIKECWHSPKASLVMKKKVPVWQVPPWNQPPIKTLSCYREDGYITVDPNETQ